MLDFSHMINVLVKKVRAEAVIRIKNLILDVIGRTAGRLIKGENFYSGMIKIPGEPGQVTDAAGTITRYVTTLVLRDSPAC